VTVSGITYDDFSRVIAYDYDVSCSDGSHRRTGSVHDIAYNNLGEALSLEYSVNGRECGKVTYSDP
jgi:hypothetical protein